MTDTTRDKVDALSPTLRRLLREIAFGGGRQTNTELAIATNAFGSSISARLAELERLGAIAVSGHTRGRMIELLWRDVLDDDEGPLADHPCGQRARPATRRCLSCDTAFHSSHAGNRLCPLCVDAEASADRQVHALENIRPTAGQQRDAVCRRLAW